MSTRGAWCALVACSTIAVGAAGQSPLQRLLVAEDSRGHGPDGIAPIVEALGSPDTMLRRVAVRAAGRLQREDLVPQLLPILRDTVAAVRATAAAAITQTIVVTRAPDHGDPRTDADADSLIAALIRETDPEAAAVEANELGRFPFASVAAETRAETAITDRLTEDPSYGAARGLYALAGWLGARGELSPASVAALQRVALQPTVGPATQRMALLALTTAHVATDELLETAVRDPDAQVRRLAIAGSTRMDSAVRTAMIAAGLHDASAIVRIAAITASRQGRAAIDCAPLVDATRDAVMYVRLTALDGLGAPCADAAAATTALVATIARRRSGLPAHAWQEPSHALVALAKVDSAAARPFIDEQMRAARWEERLYAARAAAVTGDVAALDHLARDADHNVDEAAVDGLHRWRGHDADAIYIAVLASDGHQAARAAALALRGSTDPAAAPALWRALARLTATRSENTRDPRVAILQTLRGMPGGRDSVRLAPYRRDFDSTVAQLASAAGRGNGQPVPLPIERAPLAGIMSLAVRPQLVVTLADSTGGGSFVITLLSDETPATVARVVRLARAHYYDGHVFHRVEPDFVVQGGGPDASEYAGDRQFMRDELTPRAQARGTVGISTRGRDTGDAQWFINLVDNPRLDHDYTVFGEITAGRDVAERIQEGDVIAHVAVRGGVP